jgi:hypothetical protein
VALLLVLALLGCTSGAPEAPTDRAAEAPRGAAATTTRGAELRAALTWLLTERVHLVLTHTGALAAAQGRSSVPGVVAARRALDESAASTVEVLADSYPGGRSQLLPALRTHDAALLARTAAPVDDEAADAALDDARAGLAACRPPRGPPAAHP